MCAEYRGLSSGVKQVAAAPKLRRQDQKPFLMHKEIFEKMLCLTGSLVWVIRKNVTSKNCSFNPNVSKSVERFALSKIL